MSNEARIAANRRNAKKSAGPRSEQGKAVVARNAIKHGLLARTDVIPGEDLAEYEHSRRNALAELNPLGHIETRLAERIVSLLWRLERAQRLQNGALDYLLTREATDSLEEFDDFVTDEDIEQMQSDPDTDPRLIVGRVVVNDCLQGRVLDRLMLHERRIDTALSKAMSDLQRFQRQRKTQESLKCEVSSVKSEDGDALLQTSHFKLETSPKTPDGVTTNEVDPDRQTHPADDTRRDTEPTQAAEPACSVPVRASHVAQPPSAGVLADGATSECAKQSQESAQLPVGSCQQEPGNPTGSCELGTVNSAETPYGVTTSEDDHAKQSQCPPPVKRYQTLPPRARVAWHYKGGPHSR